MVGPRPYTTVAMGRMLLLCAQVRVWLLWKEIKGECIEKLSPS